MAYVKVYRFAHAHFFYLLIWFNNYLFQQHQLKDLSTAIAQSDVARRKKLSTEKKDPNEKKTKS